MSRQTDTATDYDSIMSALSSRRRFLAGTAAIGSAALAGCSGDGDDGGMATDEPTETPMETTETPMEETETTEEPPHPDVDVLNYALTLEHLEHAFYREGLNQFSDSQLMNAGPVSNFGREVRSSVPERLQTIRAHEKGHVDTITSVIEDQLGGTAVGEADYTFDLDSAATFIATAQVLENTGVAAYKGAAPAVKTNSLLSAALGIHSVEARHASFLNTINGASPYPNGFDPAKSPAEVKEAANPFFSADITQSETVLDGEGEPTADRKASDDTSDVDVLNYALTLEHLEHAFYRDGLKALSDLQLERADVLSAFGDEVKQSVPMRLKTVRDHEKAHVDAIVQTVEKLGGTPVEEAEYTFEYDSASKFIATAQVLENTGVAAYAGAAPTVSNDEVFGAAAAIHSVEARHAGFLNELNGGSAYPDAVDEAKTMEEVTEAVQPFIQ